MFFVVFLMPQKYSKYNYSDVLILLFLLIIVNILINNLL